MHCLLLPIEHISTVTGNRVVVIEWIARVVRKGDEIDCSRIGLQFYVGIFVKGRYQTIGDGHPGEITDVENATTRVCSFLAPGWFA